MKHAETITNFLHPCGYDGGVVEGAQLVAIVVHPLHVELLLALLELLLERPTRMLSRASPLSMDRSNW